MRPHFPHLWRRRPKFGFKPRLRATALALLIALMIVPMATWVKRSLAADDMATSTSAPAAPQKGVAELKAPGHFLGLVDEKGNPAPDSTGQRYGASATPPELYDVTKPGEEAMPGDNPSKLSSAELNDRILHTEYSINFVWTLLCGFLVMLMQLGFAMIETGLCRAKNAGHTFAMNLMIYPLACLGFYAYGFALGWGNWFNGPKGPGWFPALGPGLSCLNSGLTLNLGGHAWNVLGTKGFFLHGVNDVAPWPCFSS